MVAGGGCARAQNTGRPEIDSSNLINVVVAIRKATRICVTMYHTTPTNRGQHIVSGLFCWARWLVNSMASPACWKPATVQLPPPVTLIHHRVRSAFAVAVGSTYRPVAERGRINALEASWKRASEN